MAHPTALTVSAGRKVSRNYSSREVVYSITVELEPGDNPGTVFAFYVLKLQDMVDAELGDAQSPNSFAAHRASHTTHVSTEPPAVSHGQ